MLGEEEDIEEFDFEDWCCRLLKKRPRNVEDEFPIDQAKVAAYYASVAQKLGQFLNQSHEPLVDANAAFPVSLTPQTKESVARGIRNSYKGFLRRLLHAALEVAPEQLAVLNAAANDHSAVTNKMLQAWADRLAMAKSEEHCQLAKELRNEACAVVQGVLEMKALPTPDVVKILSAALLDWERRCGARATVAAWRRWHSRFVRSGGTRAWLSIQTQHPRLACSLKEALGGVDTRSLIKATPTGATLATIAGGLGAPGVASRGQVACASALAQSEWVSSRKPDHECFNGLELVICDGSVAEVDLMQRVSILPPAHLGIVANAPNGRLYVRPARALSEVEAVPHAWALPRVRWLVLLAHILEKGVLADRFWVGANYAQRVASMELQTYRSALQRIIAQTLQPHGEAIKHPLQKIQRPMPPKT